MEESCREGRGESEGRQTTGRLEVNQQGTEESDIKQNTKRDIRQKDQRCQISGRSIINEHKVCCKYSCTHNYQCSMQI